jgi:hypothetical protein
VLYYRCPSRSDGGRNCVARKAEDVDRLILRAIFRRAVWPGMSLDRRRAILAALIEWIKVYPQGQGRDFNPDAIEMKPRGWR